MSKSLVLWFLCLRMVLTQPVSIENNREPRQVDFRECCPCPETRSVTPPPVNARSNDDSCPCKLDPDSEPAASIFKPAFRAIESYNRPTMTKTEPKPLLNPEVGLANSVLQTLQEATDQEYQEALVRDAARNAISDSDDRSIIEDAPKNIVNIILKAKENVDDVISDASNVQQTRCIHPNSSPLGISNQFGQLRQPTNLLGKVFALPNLSKFPNNLNKIYDDDMVNSPSNLKEQVLNPLKVNILDDLKRKSDVLKMKLFPNLHNSLKYKQPNDDKVDCNGNDFIRSDLNVARYVPTLDHIQSSPIKDFKDETQENIFMKEANNIKSIARPKTAEQNMDLEFSPRQNYYYTSTDNLDSLSKLNDKENTMKDFNQDTFVSLTDNNNVENNNDCSINHKQLLINKETSTPAKTEILEVFPSLADINKITNAGSETEQGTNDNNDSVLLKLNNKDDKKNLDSSDSETDASNHDYEIISTDRKRDEFLKSSNKQAEPILGKEQNKNILIQKESLSKTSTINILPNIKGDISKTLESFNNNMKEKLRSNIKNVFQSSGIKNCSTTEDITIPSSVTDFKTKNLNEDDKLSMQDLEDMSNRILNLSESSPHFLDDDDNETLSENLQETTKPIMDLDKISQKSFIINNITEKNNDDVLTELESRNKFCSDLKPTNINSAKTSNNDQENEMMSQASSPSINSILNPGFNNNLNVQEFLENLQSSLSDILKRDRTDQNLNTYPDNAKQYSFEEPLVRARKPINIDYSKSTVRDELLTPIKNNNNLNSYKARVASPDTLQMKASPLLRNTEQNFPQSLFKNNIQTKPASNILRSPLEIPSIFNENSLKDLESIHLKERIPSQEITPLSSSIKTFSENLKSKTEGALRNIQNIYDDTLKIPQMRSNNNVFGETITKPIVFGSISKPNDDLGKKLQALHTNLMDKLSFRPSPVSSLGNHFRKTEDIINDLGNGLKSNSKLNLEQRIRNTLKRNQNSLSKPNKSSLSSIRKEAIPKSFLQQKSELASPRTVDLIAKPQKASHKTDIKRKFPKENKVTFSFTTSTMPPNLIKQGSITKKGNKPTPATLRSSINLPKPLSTLRAPTQKKLDLKSKLISNDPKTSASEKISHAALPDRLFGNSPAISEEELITPKAKSLQDEANTQTNTNGFSKVERLKGDILRLPKLKSAINSKTTNYKNTDQRREAEESASNNIINIASATSLEKPLKENVSYKCKMVCFEDKTE